MRIVGARGTLIRGFSKYPGYHDDAHLQPIPISVTDTLLRSFRPLLFFFLFLLVLLPSGSVLGINVKVIVFLLLGLAAVTRYLDNPKSSFLSLSYIIAVPLSLMAWVLLSPIYGVDMALSFAQYRDLIVTIAGCWFVFLLGTDRDSDRPFLRLVLSAVLCTSLIKGVILAYAALRGIPVGSIIDVISNAFGTQLMTVDLGDFGGRIEFISDGLIPLCLFAVFGLRQELRLSQKAALLYSAIFAASALLSFSRYLWVFAVFSLLLGFIVAKKKERFHWLWVAICTGIVIYNFQIILLLVAFRFSSVVASSSDIERHAQAIALAHFFMDAPIFGHGLGSFTSEVVRSGKLPYSYENQLFALCGQIGIIGVLLLAAMLLSYFRPLIPRGRTEVLYKGSVACLLIFWVSGGIVNPCLISSTAAVSYAMLRVLAKIERTPAEASPSAL